MVGGEASQMWIATLSKPQRIPVRSLPNGPILTIDRTIFELWLESSIGLSGMARRIIL